MTQQEQRMVYHFDRFAADPIRRQLYARGEHLSLTPKAFQTLMVLISERGTVVSKQDLLDRIWPDTTVEENNLTQQIATLRRVLGERAGQHRFIVTVPGEGYTFVAAVEETAPADEFVRLTRGGEVRPLTFRRGPASPAATGVLIALLYVIGVVLPVFIKGLIGPARQLPQTVAVLPFRTSGGDEEALGMGIRDTLRARLGSLDDVTLRPARFELPGGDVIAAGREMDASVVFTGSVQHHEGRVRVALEMLDVETERVVWGQTFDYDRSRHFELQDQIAVEAVRVVRTRS